MSKNLTQEKYRVESGQKQIKCTECTALASPRAPREPCAPSRARPKPCRGPVTVLQHSPCPCPLPGHNTIFVLRYYLSAAKPAAIQFLEYNSSQPAIQTSVLQYKIFQPSLLYCNSMQPLQYNFPLGCNTIQPLLAI